MVTVVVKPPTSAETLRKNPLGLYVDAIDWSRELDTPTPAAPTTATTTRMSTPTEQPAVAAEVVLIPTPDAAPASTQEAQ